MSCRELRFVLSVVFYVVNENPQNCICSKSCKKQKKTPEIRRFQVFFGAADQIRTGDLILTNHRRAFQPLLYKALRRYFCPKRIRSQPVCSIVSVRSFPRVGHGVGQADTSASKKPRTGFAVIFRFAISRS